MSWRSTRWIILAVACFNFIAVGSPGGPPWWLSLASGLAAIAAFILATESE